MKGEKNIEVYWEVERSRQFGDIIGGQVTEFADGLNSGDGVKEGGINPKLILGL